METKGAVHALLAIYEQAILDIVATIKEIPDHDLILETDPKSLDENCKSLQAILTHVVHAGYGYAASIENLKGANLTRPDKKFHPEVQKYADDMLSVFEFTETVLKDLTDSDLEEHDDSRKIISGWGQLYDIEQMMEHAIVHVLRHTRQIKKIRTKIG